MKSDRIWNIQRSRQQGFSFLELMVVIAVMTVIMGVVFNYIVVVQQRYKTEESRLDVAQESREFIDQMVRDLHTVGYPNARMYSSTALGTPAQNNVLLAAGLVAVSATDIWFEGDTDSSGNVHSIRYTLTNDGSGNCPCTVSRSDQSKTNAAPTAQGTKYAIDLQNVVNSTGGMGATAYTISGSTRFGVTNDVYYSSFKTPALFAYYDSSGNAITVPADLSTSGNVTAGVAAAASVARISITINVLSPNSDMKTGVRPGFTMRSDVKVNNL